MALRRQVHCVVRDNSEHGNQRITHLGGRNPDGTRWYATTTEAISRIHSGEWTFFISVAGNETEVIVRQREDTWVLTTQRDAYEGNNLGNLPECIP